MKTAFVERKGEALLESARVLLLVEDNPRDADLVREMLAQTARDGYDIVHASRVEDAVSTLRATRVDVVVLDLSLPDCSGVETVQRMRAAAGDVPIVVLTGNDDSVALACIDAGAQDYLSKAEVRTQSLRRALGYAITRLRERQLRELTRTLDRYRALSSSAQGTLVTAALAGSGAISARSPEHFQKLVDDYAALLEPYLATVATGDRPPRERIETVVTAIGDASGGPRDLVDCHLAALDRAVESRDGRRAHWVVVEARLLALEMMGLLVDYYRVGHRRGFSRGPR